MKNFYFFSVLMILLLSCSSFLLLDNDGAVKYNLTPALVFVGVFVFLFFLVKVDNDKRKTVKNKNIHKRFKRMAKYLPYLENDQVRILEICLGKAGGEVMIFRPNKVRKLKRILGNTETFSAECLLSDGRVVYIYIARDGDMIDFVWTGEDANTDCCSFDFTPEKTIQEDGTEIPIFATS